MLANVFIVDFLDAFNPLYAIPIVAVLLCIFLVYAFGFKAPVQPPSFDELETDKKTISKRRRNKEVQKNKQQNEKVKQNNEDKKKSQDNPPHNKKKVEKSASAKSAKVENKVTKKQTNASEKKKPVPNVIENTPAVEDVTGDGWVHLVSKKGRKGQKKDEVVHANMLSTLDVPEFDTSISVKETDHSDAQDLVSIIEDNTLKHTTDVCDIIVDEKNVSPKKSAKKSPSKKRDVNDVDAVSSEFFKVPINTITVSDQQENKLNSSNDPVHVQKESFNHEPCEMSDSAKAMKEQKQPRKKKKKKNNAVEDCIVAETLPDATIDFIQPKLIPKIPESNCVSSGLPTHNSHEALDNLSSKEPALIDRTYCHTNDNDEGKEIEDTCNLESTKGTNVAFDEMEGMFQDKVQKKRKKVRREH